MTFWDSSGEQSRTTSNHMKPAIRRDDTVKERGVNHTTRRRTFDAVSALFPVSWIGMIVGVSFIATPAKFLAPSLGSRAAFDVGRVTFELFNSIEVGLAIVLLAIALYRERRILTNVFAASVLAITVMQALVVLPVLGDRVSAIIAGYGVAPSYVHSLYVLMEAAKTGLLVAIAAQWVLYGVGDVSHDPNARRYTWAAR